MQKFGDAPNRAGRIPDAILSAYSIQSPQAQGALQFTARQKPMFP